MNGVSPQRLKKLGACYSSTDMFRCMTYLVLLINDLTGLSTSLVYLFSFMNQLNPHC